MRLPTPAASTITSSGITRILGQYPVDLRGEEGQPLPTVASDVGHWSWCGRSPKAAARNSTGDVRRAHQEGNGRKGQEIARARRFRSGDSSRNTPSERDRKSTRLNSSHVKISY